MSVDLCYNYKDECTPYCAYTCTYSEKNYGYCCEETNFPTWAIVVIIVVFLLFAAGIFLAFFCACKHGVKFLSSRAQQQNTVTTITTTQPVQQVGTVLQNPGYQQQPVQQGQYQQPTQQYGYQQPVQQQQQYYQQPQVSQITTPINNAPVQQLPVTDKITSPQNYL